MFLIGKSVIASEIQGPIYRHSVQELDIFFVFVDHIAKLHSTPSSERDAITFTVMTSAVAARYWTGWAGQARKGGALVQDMGLQPNFAL